MLIMLIKRLFYVVWISLLLTSCVSASTAISVPRAELASSPTITALPAPTPSPSYIITPTSLPSSLRSVSGNLSNQVTYLESDMPGVGSERFVAPTAGEQAAFAQLVARIEAGDTGKAESIAAENGYELVQYTDRLEVAGDATGFLLRELKPIRRGWGLYLFRKGPAQDIIVEAPHPLYDEGTPAVAMAAYRALQAKALLIAGAHRAANRDGSADVAHHRQTIFEAVHEALAKSSSTAILQIHGFAAGKHPGYPQVVLSSDEAAASELLDRLAAALEAQGIRVGECGSGAWSDLCGETNIQSQYVGPAVFIHIELDESIRANSSTLLAALTQTFK